MWWLKLAMGSWEAPYLCLAKYVKSRHVMQPHWITAPAQKSSFKQRSWWWWSCESHHFPLSQKKGGWGRRHFHCTQARSLPVQWASLAESKELLRGLIPTRKQGKVLPKMSLALFLAHLWNIKYLDGGSWPNSLKSQLKKKNQSVFLELSFSDLGVYSFIFTPPRFKANQQSLQTNNKLVKNQLYMQSLK